MIRLVPSFNSTLQLEGRQGKKRSVAGGSSWNPTILIFYFRFNWEDPAIAQAPSISKASNCPTFPNHPAKATNKIP